MSTPSKRILRPTQVSPSRPELVPWDELRKIVAARRTKDSFCKAELEKSLALLDKLRADENRPVNCGQGAAPGEITSLNASLAKAGSRFRVWSVWDYGQGWRGGGRAGYFAICDVYMRAASAKNSQP